MGSGSGMNILLSELVLESASLLPQEAFMPGSFPQIVQSQAESHFCTPAAGWEKGQVESGVGFGRRNYLVPIREAATFADLNTVLFERCLQDDTRRVSRQ